MLASSTSVLLAAQNRFQLTLKEGLTVFRDQEFTADMTSRAVKRINDVSMLRASQFSEDAGPMAHPIRPDSYLKMVRAEKPCLRRRLWKCHASGGRISPLSRGGARK